MILFPKGLSQIAKTVLSIPTHLRNLFSAGAFAGANGTLFENPALIKEAFEEAFGALQVGTRGEKANAAYQELLGRDVTSEELSTARQRFDTGYYKDIDSLKSSLTSGSEYQDKFQQSYLANYYDTQFGKELRDDEGKRTGKRKFSFDKTLLPSYGEDMEKRTGVTLPDFGDSFTGTPGEIDEQLNNIRQTRNYIFDSGLTALQGDINKNIAELKVEGQKEITKISKAGDMYQSVINAFNFS